MKLTGAVGRQGGTSGGRRNRILPAERRTVATGDPGWKGGGER